MLQALNLPEPATEWPFSLPLLESTRRIEFTAPVTVIVGENGSGKSTLLEAIAIAAQLPAAGSAESAGFDPTLSSVRPLANDMRLEWTHRSRRGMFLRAEDFFGYVQQQNTQDAELLRQARQLEQDNPDMPALELRRIQAPFTGPVSARSARYGGDLDARSHGEAFMSFFRGRLRGPGLYVLDEPEAALSPVRQLAFLALLREAVTGGAQFIIATHAPILMALPDALLLEIRDGQIQRAEFDELEHVRTLRDFLDDPGAFLRHL